MDNQSDEPKPLTTLDGDSAVIAVVGDLDAASCDTLNNAAHEAVDRGARHLIFDLSGVEFMDSSGITALIASRSIASVAIRKPSPPVTRLIELTGLTDVLAVEP